MSKLKDVLGVLSRPLPVLWMARAMICVLIAGTWTVLSRSGGTAISSSSAAIPAAGVPHNRPTTKQDGILPFKETTRSSTTVSSGTMAADKAAATIATISLPGGARLPLETATIETFRADPSRSHMTNVHEPRRADTHRANPKTSYRRGQRRGGVLLRIARKTGSAIQRVFRFRH